MVALKPRPTTPGPAGPPGAAGPPGSAGDPGPAGPAGGTYLHIQNSPQSTWSVVHNLGFKPGGVAVIDSAGTVVEGQITHLDVNSLRLDFSVPFSGTASLS